MPASCRGDTCRGGCPAEDVATCVRGAMELALSVVFWAWRDSCTGRARRGQPMPPTSHGDSAWFPSCDNCGFETHVVPLACCGTRFCGACTGTVCQCPAPDVAYHWIGATGRRLGAPLPANADEPAPLPPSASHDGRYGLWQLRAVRRRADDTLAIVCPRQWALEASRRLCNDRCSVCHCSWDDGPPPAGCRCCLGHEDRHICDNCVVQEGEELRCPWDLCNESCAVCHCSWNDDPPRAGCRHFVGHGDGHICDNCL